MNLDNFVDVTAIHTGNTKSLSNKIFFTFSNDKLSFSSASVRAMKDVPRVRVMTNKKDNQILFLQSNGAGLRFMSHSKKVPMVNWCNSEGISTVKSMLPSGRSNRVHVLGEAVEVQGKKGLLFSCNNLEDMPERKSK